MHMQQRGRFLGAAIGGEERLQGPDQVGAVRAVDILFKDAGFALIDFAALLRFRCASRNLISTGGFSCLRLSLTFPTTYDRL